jgi:predicted nucleic acid-binding protein
MQDGIKLLNNSGLVLHSFTKSNLEEAALMAKRYTTTVYDMLYAVVAKENVCELVTADEKFVKLSKFGYVKLL